MCNISVTIIILPFPSSLYPYHLFLSRQTYKASLLSWRRDKLLVPPVQAKSTQVSSVRGRLTSSSFACLTLQVAGLTFHLDTLRLHWRALRSVTHAWLPTLKVEATYHAPVHCCYSCVSGCILLAMEMELRTLHLVPSACL